MPPPLHITPPHVPLLSHLSLDAQSLFTHPRIKVWRSIPERENATLDATRPDGSPIRLHIKRYHPTRSKISPAALEAAGIHLLQQSHIPTVPLVAYATLPDRRSVIVSEDLTGYLPADQALAKGLPIDQLLPPLASLVASLHSARLHHRDLYLCHFFVNDALDLRLIDAGRVKRLPPWPFSRRWIVKDLAQLLHSLTEIHLPFTIFQDFLSRYASQLGQQNTTLLTRSIRAKSRRIARHDRNLRSAHPTRNVSIPQ